MPLSTELPPCPNRATRALALLACRPHATGFVLGAEFGIQRREMTGPRDGGRRASFCLSGVAAHSLSHDTAMEKRDSPTGQQGNVRASER